MEYKSAQPCRVRTSEGTGLNTVDLILPVPSRYKTALLETVLVIFDIAVTSERLVSLTDDCVRMLTE
jgi:hypothetical protein